MRRRWGSISDGLCLPGNARRLSAGWRGILAAAAGKAVTLFNDTFTNHYDPEIGIAALEILERGGCRVNVVRPGCCGRPLISQGMLAEARAHAEKLVEGLFPIADRGEKILFCEPSCLSAVKEDARLAVARGRAAEGAGRGANACLSFEEFAGQLELPLRAGRSGFCCMGIVIRNRWVCFGPLCAARAHSVGDGGGSGCGLLRHGGFVWVFAKALRCVEAIANRRLLPAVKAMKAGDVLVAPGTSCRRQVAELDGRTGVHPAVLIRSLL